MPSPSLSRRHGEMWRNINAPKSGNAFLKVLYLIIQDQGGNDLVEINRRLTVFLEENVENDSSRDEYNGEQ